MRWLKIAWYYLVSTLIGILDQDAAYFWYSERMRRLDKKYPKR